MLDRLDAQERKIGDLGARIDLTHGALQRVEALGNRIVVTLGEETEDGKGGYVGKGLLGRVGRNEIAVKRLRDAYGRWIAYGAGFFTCGGAMLIAIWWLVGDKIAIILKATGH